MSAKNPHGLPFWLMLTLFGLAPESLPQNMDLSPRQTRPKILSAPFPLSLGYSTYLGGAAYDVGIDIAVDSAGSAYVLGLTSSTNFPKGNLSSDRIQATFITKFSPAGDTIEYTKLLPYCIGRGIAVNPQGQAVVVGSTGWIDFPVTTNAFQKNLVGGQDGFILELSTNGSDVIYSSFFGGTGDDFAMDVALDSSGNICVAGITSSTNFPVMNAAQGQSGGDFDGFVLKFNLAGNRLVYSTYLGGSSADQCFGVAVDPSGNVAVTGRTISTDFPMRRAFQASSGGGSDAFVAKFDSSGAKIFATYLGGGGSDSGSAIAMETNGNMTVLGITSSTNIPLVNAFQATLRGSMNNFITRISSNGSLLVFSTYLGGELNEGDPEIYETFTAGIPIALAGIAVDAAGFTYLTSTTDSGPSFPARNSLKLNPESYFTDAYAAKLDPAGGLVFATLLGSSAEDHGHGLALDTNGNIFITGITAFNYRPANFPITAGAFQTQLSGPFTNGYVGYDAFVTKLAQQPYSNINDNFANRPVLGGTRWTLLGENSFATKEPGEPNHAGNSGGKSLWWSWTAPADGKAWLTTIGSSFDTIVAVYTGSALSNLVPVVSANSSGSSNTEMKFKVQAGKTYNIAVDGNNGASGQITLTLMLGEPANDDFINRTQLQGLTVQTNGSNLEATTEAGESVNYGGSGRSVWYTWAAPTNGLFAVEVSNDYFIPHVFIYIGSDVGSLTPVAGDDYFPRAVFKATAGTNYQIRIDGADGASGPFSLMLAPASPPPNDDFESRTLLNGSLVITNGSNFNSTAQDSDPKLVDLFSIYYARGSTIWWGWTAPTNGSIILQAVTTNFSPILAVFTGSSLTNLIPVAATSPNDNKAQLLITNIIKGVQYQIMVDEVEWERPGNVELSLTLIMPPRFQIPRLPSATGFELNVQGVIDRTYRIENSADLTNWTLLSASVATNGLLRLIDANLTNRTRFYRAVELP